MNIKYLKKLGFFLENLIASNNYTYTTQPTRDIDLWRFLDSHDDFYRIPNEARELKKKRIIITDPTIAFDKMFGSNFTQDSFREKVNLWCECIKQNFPVYVFTKEGLRQVTHPKDLILALENVDPINPINHLDLVKYLAEEGGLASKDYYLAGTEQVNQLLSDNERSWFSGDAITISNLTMLPQITLKKFLDGGSISLPIFSNDLFDIKNLAFLLDQLEQHPNIDLHLIVISSDTEVTASLPTILKKIQSLPIVAKRLKSFTSHEIGGWHQITALLQACPSIENLTYVNTDDDMDTLESINFTTALKKIKLTYSSQCTWETIAQLLKCSPSLETLDLNEVELTDNMPQDFTLPRTALVNMTLTDTSIGLRLSHRRPGKNCHNY